MAEKTGRAVAVAKEAVEAETMLARAKAEAHAWSKGTATTAKLANDMTPLQIQQLVAERNQLRVQCRMAEAEVRKVDEASGGGFPSLVRMCQADMERLAKLRSAVEKSHLDLQSQLRTKLDELAETKRQLKSADLRAATSEEEVAELSETIMTLNGVIRDLQTQISDNHEEYEAKIHQVVESTHARMTAEHVAEKEQAMRRMSTVMLEEKRQALEQTRDHHAAQAEHTLATKLSEQKHTLLAQAQKEKHDEITELQNAFQQREQQNMAALKARMDAERDQVVTALEQRIATIEARSSGDIERLKIAHELEMEKELEELKSRMETEAKHETEARLHHLQSTLEARSKEAVEKVKATLMRKQADELTCAVKRATDTQKKRMSSEHEQDKAKAIRELTARLQLEKREAVTELHEKLNRKNEVQLEMRVKAATEGLERRLKAEYVRDKAKTVERVVAEAKTEKTKSLSQTRSRMETQINIDVAELKRANSSLSDEISQLRREKAVQAERLQTEARKEKTVALDSLRVRLAKQHDNVNKQNKQTITELRAELENVRQEKAAAIKSAELKLREKTTGATQKLRARIETQRDADERELKAQIDFLSQELKSTKASHAQILEQLQAEFRVEKTREIESQRERMARQCDVDVAKFRTESEKLAAEVKRLSAEVRSVSTDEQRTATRCKQSGQTLAGMLRRLLNDMKIALVPRVNAPLDTSVSTPSQSMGALQVLIKGLSVAPFDVSALESPSPEANVAPLVAMDILYTCALELAQYLNAANEELTAMSYEVESPTVICFF